MPHPHLRLQDPTGYLSLLVRPDSTAHGAQLLGGLRSREASKFIALSRQTGRVPRYLLHLFLPHMLLIPELFAHERVQMRHVSAQNMEDGI